MSALSPVLRLATDNTLIFMCPGCSMRHMIPVGDGAGQRWTWNGNSERPTFSPSVLVAYNGPDAGMDQGDGDFAPPAICHSFVTDGRIHFLEDSTHGLAGATVDLPIFANSGEN